MQELRNITIGDMLEETARKFPTNQAVKYIEMEFDKTYYEVNNKVDRITEADRLCIPVPLFHCFGMALAIMTCVTHGSTMIPLLWYIMHAIEYEKCTAEATEDEIKAFDNKTLSKHKVPSRALFTDSTPLIASGKIQKYLLRDKAIELLNLKNAAVIETA